MKRKLPVFYRVIIYLFISLAIYFDEIYIDFFRKGSKVMTATRWSFFSHTFYTFIPALSVVFISTILTDVPYEPILHQPILEQCNIINVSWSPPTREALGDPVTLYVPQIKMTESKGSWINCTRFSFLNPMSCLFTNSTQYTHYDVRVLAKNKIGYSLPSSVLQISTEEAGILSNHHHYSIINYDLKKKNLFHTSLSK